MQGKEKEISVSYINTIKSFSLKKSVKGLLVNRGEAHKDIQTKNTYLELSIQYENELAEVFLLEKLKKEGFILSYGEGAVLNDYPSFYTVGIRFNSGTEVQTSWGYVSLLQQKRLAYEKALYEAVERHATMSPPLNKIKTKDVSWIFDLTPRYSQAQTKQFPQLLNSKESLIKISCIPAKKEGFFLEKVWLPVHLFYYGSSVSERTTHYLQQPTSSGSAVGKDLVSAKVAALCELIERDHFLLFWLSGVKPRLIENINLTENPAIMRILLEAKKYNLSVSFFDMTYDMSVPVVFCLCIDETLSLVSCGAKCSFSIDENIEGSFYEALSVLSAMRIRDGYKDLPSKDVLLNEDGMFLSGNLDRKKRVVYYSTPHGVKFIKDFFKTEKHIDYFNYKRGFRSDLKKSEQLSCILSSLKRKQGTGDEYSLFFVEQVTAFTRKLNVKAVHVYVPAFLKLYLSEHFATPISLRLSQFAESHGKKILTAQDINHHPHFFP